MFDLVFVLEFVYDFCNWIKEWRFMLVLLFEINSIRFRGLYIY